MRLSPRASQSVAELIREIARIREQRKVFALALRSLGALLECSRGALFLYKRSTGKLYKVTSLSEHESWNMETLTAFFRNERPDLDLNVVMAPVRVGPTVVGVATLMKEGPIEPGAGKVATEILGIVGVMLACRREMAVSMSESGTSRAVLRGVGPKDVAYRVFHVLRRFIDYDHGATLIGRLDQYRGRVVARQVAWTKGKSEIVGKVLSFTWGSLAKEFSMIDDRDEQSELYQAVAAASEEASPPKLSAIVVPLYDGPHLLGCLEVSSSRRDFFVDRDAQLLSRFVPHILWCLRGLTTENGG
jgi:GAF domain-containing protein